MGTKPGPNILDRHSDGSEAAQCCRLTLLLQVEWIPGTSSVEHLEENVAAASLKMDRNKIQELSRAARAH